MNKFIYFKRCRTLLVFSMLVTCLSGFGQTKTYTYDIHKSSFLLPQPLPGGHFSSSLALLYVVTPKDWTLDNITAPMFAYQAKYTLPLGFNVQGSLSTLFISNRILIGPFWNYEFMKNNYIGLGWQAAWNYGRLQQFGFATTLTGWEQQPSVTYGHSFAKTALTVRADLYWTNRLYLTEGGHPLPVANSFINGYSFKASFEQFLYRNKSLSLGLQMDYVQYHIIAWPAFPVNGKRYWMPEFQVGLNF